jgi:hypothetical protein
MAAYRLTPRDPVARDLTLLAPGATEETVLVMPRAPLELAIENRGRATFVHPDPLAPSNLLLRWYDARGGVVHEEAIRALLPIALAAGAGFPLVVDVTTPETPGRYEVTLARREAPDHVLARRAVHLPRLEDVLAPAQLALHLNRDFVRDVLFAEGIAYVAPPAARAEMILAPGVESAAEVAAREPLHAHWIDAVDERVHRTDAVRGEIRPTAAEGRIDVRLSVPDRPRPWVVLLTPADDPRTVLAGRSLFADEEPRPSPPTSVSRPLRGW